LVVSALGNMQVFRDLSPVSANTASSTAMWTSSAWGQVFGRNSFLEGFEDFAPSCHWIIFCSISIATCASLIAKTASANRASSFREDVNLATSSRIFPRRPPCSIFDVFSCPPSILFLVKKIRFSLPSTSLLAFLSEFVYACLQSPEFYESFAVGLVEAGFLCCSWRGFCRRASLGSCVRLLGDCLCRV